MGENLTVVSVFYAVCRVLIDSTSHNEQTAGGISDVKTEFLKEVIMK